MADVLIVTSRNHEKATVSAQTLPARKWMKDNMTLHFLGEELALVVDYDSVQELEQRMSAAGLSITVR